jgi:hypothetical protein
VGDEDDRGVEPDERLLEPLERLDVQVVRRLVEQQQVGLGGERPRERRAGELAARRRSRAAVQVGVGEAEAVHGDPGLLAPAVAADGLEARVDVGVPRHRPVVSRRHRLLEAAELGLELQGLLRPGEDVVAQRQVALSRRALVVEAHAGVLGQDELAAVVGGLARQDAQERRSCPAPLRPGDREAVAPLELEGDAPPQRLADHVLGEVGGDEDGHDPMVGSRALMRPSLLAAAALVLAALLIPAPAQAERPPDVIRGAPAPGPARFDR